ncbi:hypothetical protein D5086_024445 [Populus alba]|uniref:Uncharacterized protein n=1 Tax=Populus alba TaxID=43335 RepID=A0ACC4B724_POPAL
MTIQKILPFVLLQFLYFHELHAQIPPTISSGSNITAGSETGQNKVHLVFNNDTASMYLANGAGDNIYALTRNVSTPVGDYYHRATINDRGDFQQFAYHKSNNSGWTRVWRAIDEPCVVNAICGVYGMCSSLNNGNKQHVIAYQVIDDADFPFEGFADLARVRNVDLEGCKKALMDDCYSLSASLVDSRCIKKRMPLLNARKSFSTKGRQALVKLLPRLSFSVLEFLPSYYHPAPRRFIKRKRYSNASSIGINFQEFKRHIEPSRVEEESEEDDLVLSDWVISCMAAGKLETVTFYEKGNTNVGGDLGNRNPAFTFRSNVSENTR